MRSIPGGGRCGRMERDPHPAHFVRRRYAVAIGPHKGEIKKKSGHQKYPSFFFFSIDAFSS
jgi:hypothetical protein